MSNNTKPERKEEPEEYLCLRCGTAVSDISVDFCNDCILKNFFEDCTQAQKNHTTRES